MVSNARKTVVTGGAGFIGSHLVDRLMDDGCREVVVLDNLHHGRMENLSRHQGDGRLQFIHGDVRDADLVRSVFEDAQTVYHLAAERSTSTTIVAADYAFQTNVVGTFNVLRAAADARVERLLFASSCDVYGDPIELPVTEDQPLLAVNMLGASKMVGEAYCRAFRRTRGLSSVVLRLANVYGPRDTGGLIPSWVNRAAAGEALIIFGGKQLLDFIWIDQVVQALTRAADSTASLPALNIGNGTGTRIMDLARRIIRATGSRGRVSVAPARPFDVTRFVADVTRMRKMLAIEPSDDPLAHLEALIASSLLTATA